MKRKWVLLLNVLLLCGAAAALAQSGGDYDVGWQVMAGAGDQFVSGGDYQVGFTLAQSTEPGIGAGGDYQVVQGYWAAGGSNPTAVRLVAFGARPRGVDLVVFWETAAEVDLLGFHLYRSASNAPGSYVRLNETLIPARAPGGGQGARYEWVDAAAERGQSYFYLLEDLDIQGAATAHGPVQGTRPAAAIFLPCLVK